MRGEQLARGKEEARDKEERGVGSASANTAPRRAWRAPWGSVRADASECGSKAVELDLLKRCVTQTACRRALSVAKILIQQMPK
eukprot:600329-Pleurochrysis_carterae.AAC.2